MTNFFNRLFSAFSGESLPSTTEIFLQHSIQIQHLETASRVQELESTIHQQKQQINEAVSLLQTAAFLAGYHQPPLARDIRLFLTQVRAANRQGDKESRPHTEAPALDLHSYRRIAS